MTQLSLSNVSVSFGASTILTDVTFTIAAGEKWGVIGRNGAGKTTIFQLITGALQPSTGSVARTPNLRVSLLEQHRDFGSARTVWDACAGAFSTLLELERSLAEQGTALGEHGEGATPQMLARYDRDLERFGREGGYTFHARVDAILQGLGFDAEEAKTRPLARLSGGERGRVGLARQLAAPADVLLLDEPTNHLDLETTDWLEDFLQETDETVLVISHDRDFLENVADHVLHVEHGTATPYIGDYVQFVAQREERRLSQQRSFDKQRRFVSEESDYIRRNIAGQNSKQAKGRRKRLARLPRLSSPPADEGAMAVRFTTNVRGGDQVLVAEKAKIARIASGESLGSRESGVESREGSGTPPHVQHASERLSTGNQNLADLIESPILITDFSTVVRRGDRIGLIGPNGAGKSTLLSTILGQHTPAGGTLRLGSGITVAYYRQDLAQVPLDRTIYECISGLRPMWERGAIMGHLGRFDFSGDEVMRSTVTLSGGERARVALAMMMLSGANLLVLDEPTNHLDVESIEALEDAVERYDGSVLLVSHDRALLRSLTTRVWSLRDRRIAVFDEGFTAWEELAEERAAAESARAATETRERKEREQRERQQAAERAKKPETRSSDKERGRDRERSGDKREGDRDARNAQRKLQREVETSEREVATLEARVSELTTSLSDPALYAGADGAARAATLGTVLEAARRDLDRALERWTRATEQLEALSR